MPRSRSWNWRGDLADNWCLVISGVGSCGAMAIVDELDGQNLINAQRAMEQCLLDIRRGAQPVFAFGRVRGRPVILGICHGNIMRLQ